jgi:hypothetical protein
VLTVNVPGFVWFLLAVVLILVIFVLVGHPLQVS